MALAIKTASKKNTAGRGLVWAVIELPNGEEIRVSAKIGTTSSTKGDPMVLIEAPKKYNIRRDDSARKESAPQHDKGDYRAKIEKQQKLVSSLGEY